MEEIKTLLVSCIPAIITGVITYLTASKKAKSEITTLQESNKHEIEKLMKQHEVDIESLKEKHELEKEKNEQEHQYKIEIMQLEHQHELERNTTEQSNSAMFSMIGNLFSDPEKIKEWMNLANDPMFNNNKKSEK